MAKQPVCCAHLTTELVRAEAEVRRIARLMSKAHANGRLTAKFTRQLETAKVELASARAAIVDHEAEHAA